MGLLSGLMQLGQQFAQKFAASFAPPGAAGDAQREWWAELQAINDRFLIPNLSIALVAIVLGACLAIGGIGLLQPKRWSREWLRRTFLFAIVFELARQAVFVVMQVAMFPVMQRQFDAMAPAGGGGNAPMDPEIFRSMQLVIMVLSYGFGVVWVLTKLIAYIWGRRYLNRDNVKAYCGETTGQD